MSSIQVLILMGSESDAPIMKGAADSLRELGVPCEMTVASAHRSPARVRRLIQDAPRRGVKVFIVGAGMAAHLAGVVAAQTTRPADRRANRVGRAQRARRVCRPCRCRRACRSQPSPSARSAPPTRVCLPRRFSRFPIRRSPRASTPTKRRWQTKSIRLRRESKRTAGADLPFARAGVTPGVESVKYLDRDLRVPCESGRLARARVGPLRPRRDCLIHRPRRHRHRQLLLGHRRRRPGRAPAHPDDHARTPAHALS